MMPMTGVISSVMHAPKIAAARGGGAAKAEYDRINPETV